MVDGPSAIPEIKDFQEHEESALIQVLKDHVNQRERIAFIEIGCGPGRVLRRISRLVLEQPTTWGRYVKYIVGIDFEIKMIERAIRNFVKKRIKIRDWVFSGLSHQVANDLNVRPKKISEKIRKRVFLVNADASQPFLHCESIVPVVAVMFGTLGNIYGLDKVLGRISELCWPNGEAFIVGFNRENSSIGQDRYDRLAKRHFSPLYGTYWKDDPGVFHSPNGFYSRWFFESQFEEILGRYFKIEKRTTPLGPSGFYSVVKPKGSISKKLTEALRSRKSKLSAVKLRCPECGNSIESGIMPLQKAAQITCENARHSFEVIDHMGFHVPILEVE